MHEFFKRKLQQNQAGFTLVELLVVVALITITVGVTGDIILTLVRSYNKTKITNDIEQNANFVMLKLEKELKNATSVSALTASSVTFIKNSTSGQTVIVYEVKDVGGVRSLVRSEDGGDEVLLTDNDPVYGVQVGDCATSACFTQISSDPYVVSINLNFSQSSASTNRMFTGTTSLSTTVVVRGSY
jgi:prepilin-type N-terminal cleavage/methylation domain-containing protein